MDEDYECDEIFTPEDRDESWTRQLRSDFVSKEMMYMMEVE